MRGGIIERCAGSIQTRRGSTRGPLSALYALNSLHDRQEMVAPGQPHRAAAIELPLKRLDSQPLELRPEVEEPVLGPFLGAIDQCPALMRQALVIDQAQADALTDVLQRGA